MTDEQLRAMARRVHLSMPGMRVSDGEYWCKDIRFGIADAIDSNAVAILREEMGKAKSRAQMSMDWIPTADEMAKISGLTTADMELPFLRDDPTKSFVATT